jgi:hypothetical protein
VGFYNKGIIGNHKRTKTFTAADYDLLVKSIDEYEILWITSHCLAEVSNLLKQTYESRAKEESIYL